MGKYGNMQQLEIDSIGAWVVNAYGLLVVSVLTAGGGRFASLAPASAFPDVKNGLEERPKA
jgi:hypothetical protein